MINGSNRNRLTRTLYIIYLIFLFWIIIFKFSLPFSSLGYMRSINLIPFSEPLIINGKLNFYELIMNAVIFIPLGIYSGVLFMTIESSQRGFLLFKKWSIRKLIFFFFLISLICEISQFILGVGASDITDIINNTLGGILGLVIYKIIAKLLKDDIKVQKFINVIALTLTVPMVLLLLLLVIYNI